MRTLVSFIFATTSIAALLGTAQHSHPLTQLLGITGKRIKFNISGDDRLSMNFMGRHSHTMSQFLQLFGQGAKRKHIAMRPADQDANVEDGDAKIEGVFFVLWHEDVAAGDHIQQRGARFGLFFVCHFVAFLLDCLLLLCCFTVVFAVWNLPCDLGGA